MVREGFDGVQFVVANTDVQALRASAAPTKVQLGEKLTKASARAPTRPSAARRLEDTDKLIQAIDGADLVFVTAGLGGGTGTGGAPVIASLASELGALTIAVVTRPFSFEGRKRAIQAERDSRNCGTASTASSRFQRAAAEHHRPHDTVARRVRGGRRSAAAGDPGHFGPHPAARADQSGLRRPQDDHDRHGVAVMGTGVGHGETRAVDAARKAISSPLLEDASIDGAAA